MKKQLVYISHPYGGNSDNIKDIEKVIRHLYTDERLYNNYCFVSPVHAFGFMYETEEYYRGLQMCIDLLAGCDHYLFCIFRTGGDQWTDLSGYCGLV